MTERKITSLDAEGKEWQLMGDNEWAIGCKVRGVVRNPQGRVWQDKTEGRLLWVWSVVTDHGLVGGTELSMDSALSAAETAIRDMPA